MTTGTGRAAFRKMTRDDFDARLGRMNADQSRGAGSKARRNADREHPFLYLLAGFGSAYLVMTVARNREAIEASLRQGSLPAQYGDWVLGGTAALLAVSAVMLGLHVFRLVLRRGTDRRNSGGLLAGVIAAGALIHTPPSVVDAAYGMLDGNSRDLIVAATSSVQDNFPGIDFSTAAFTSSNGR
ncbi:hypothetical protein [Salipiger mucosus]|uniref:Uncharacterized protein n=1 Tax=Salipiger mucosus DSM 16094 TaxID=1123237 RepID=S9S2G2_9RHOB|nr:hypothetical protein [Salipiger mucosus]EPX80394.1 hypothetical protein Salmuc_03710 [Salipiger mucosus DSM 16094]